MSEKFFYKIVPKLHTIQPDFNFAIWLDSGFAKKVLKRNISEETYNLAQSRGKQILYSCGLRDVKDVKNEYLPYEFIEEKGNLTYLLRNAKLPKDKENLCRLDFSSNGISKDIGNIKKSGEVYYFSKDVKNMEQSHILLMLWLGWFKVYNFHPKK